VLTAQLRDEYGDDERTHPVVDPRRIPFTLNQLHSGANSTILPYRSAQPAEAHSA